MEQRNELGASAEDSGHAFRYNLVAEPTRISASIVGASDGIYYDFNGERHWISPQEVEAVGMSGRSNHDEYQHQEEDPQQFATVGEKLSVMHQRPGGTEPIEMPPPAPHWKMPIHYRFAEQRIEAMEKEQRERDATREMNRKDRTTKGGYIIPINYTREEREAKRQLARGLNPVRDGGKRVGGSSVHGTYNGGGLGEL